MLSPDFIAQVEPIDELGQARLFFGKPQWPFKYKTGQKLLTVDISTAYTNALKMNMTIAKAVDTILQIANLLKLTETQNISPLRRIHWLTTQCCKYCSFNKLHDQFVIAL